MDKKLSITALLFMLFSFALFAEDSSPIEKSSTENDNWVTCNYATQKSPMANGRWQWNPKKNIDGELFYDAADAFKEQDGWAYVDGTALHYWLYDTLTYWYDDNLEWLICICIPKWIEDNGFVIDFDNCGYNPNNTKLAFSVKALMEQRDCDVSVTWLHEFDRSDANKTSEYSVIINIYGLEDHSYSLLVYPVIPLR